MSQYTDLVAADGAIAHWQFDENAGNAAVWATIGSLNGTLTNAGNTSAVSTVDAPTGIGGRSFHLDGSNDEITLVDDTLWEPASHAAMTWEIWAKLDSKKIQCLFNKGTEYNWSVGEGGGIDQVYGLTNSGSNQYEIHNTSVSINTWYHLVWVLNSGALTIYVNGSNTQTSYSTNTNTPSATATGLAIGDENVGGRAFDGLVSNAAIYHTALSGATITKHYQVGAGISTYPSATVSDTAIAGQAATVATTQSVTVAADVTNIAIAGQTATGGTTSDDTITADITNVAITGYSATVSTTWNISISATVSDTTIVGQAATGTGGTDKSVAADVANIVVSGRTATFITTTEDYDTQVGLDSPVHWYKFSNSLVDNGSGNKAFSDQYGSSVAAYGTSGPLTGTGTDVYLDMPSSSFFTNTVNATRTDWLPNPTTGGSIEFWVRTTSTTTGVLLGGLEYQSLGTDIQGSYTHTSGVSGGIGYSRNNYTHSPNMWMIGAVNGYLAQGLTNGSTITTRTSADYDAGTGNNIPGSPANDTTAYILANHITWTSTSKYIADGQWHHVVLTATTVSGSTTYKTYVDNIELIDNICPLVAGTNWAMKFRVGGWLAINYKGTSVGFTSTLVRSVQRPLDADIDEIATYSSGLTAARIQAHYNAAYGSTVLDPSPTVEADVSNISVIGQDATAGTGTMISTDTSTITIEGKGAIVSGLGSRSIGADLTNIAITGKDATVTTTQTRTITLEDNPANVGIHTGLTGILATVDDLTFSFIPADTVKLSALDTVPLSEIELGAFLYAQHKTRSFKIANQSLFYVSFIVSAVSANDGIPAAVTFSLDDQTFTESLEIPAVSPNGISPTIYMKMFISSSLNTGDGNFLINAEPTNVGS